MTYEVEEVVGAGKLLQALQDHAEDDTVEHARSSDELVPLLGLGLGLELLTDLAHLLDDAGVVFRDTVKLGQSALGALNLAMAVLEARALGEEDHSTTQDQSKQEGQAKGDTPLGSAVHSVGSQVDTVGKEDTQGDEQLVATDHGTTDVSRSTLTLVHGHQQRASTNTKTSDGTTDDHLIPVAVGRADLDHQANDQDDVPDSDRPLAANEVRKRSTKQGTHESTNTEHTNNQTSAVIRQGPSTIDVLTVSLQVVVHVLETGDLTSVVTEQQTTHGDEEGHHKGAKRDGWDRGIHSVLHRSLCGTAGGRGICPNHGGRGDLLPMVSTRFNTHDVLCGCGKGV